MCRENTPLASSAKIWGIRNWEEPGFGTLTIPPNSSSLLDASGLLFAHLFASRSYGTASQMGLAKQGGRKGSVDWLEEDEASRRHRRSV